MTIQEKHFLLENTFDDIWKIMGGFTGMQYANEEKISNLNLILQDGVYLYDKSTYSLTSLIKNVKQIGLNQNGDFLREEEII